LQLNGLASDGNTVVASLVLDNDNFIRTYAINPQTGETGSPLSQVQGYDMGQAILDPYSNAVVGSHYIGDKTETVFFDPELAGAFAKLQASFAGKSLQLVSWNQARTVFIVTMNTPGAPLSYYLYRPAEKKFSRISASRPALTKTVLGQSRPYSYTSRDGTQLKGYLTMPPGNKNAGLPLVTLMHNGPFARSAMDYNWMAQMLAANGYAVFQSNFRGSAGYGNAFHDAGYGQWGNTVRHDLDDGVKALVAQGIANPKKVCIFGSGFGGYSALLTASLSPDLYACTGAYAAISNPATYMVNIKRRMGNRSRTVIRLEHIFQGEDNSTALDDISPAAHAQNIKAKVLLMHSKDDRQIQIGQSRTMLRKLKNAGVDVSFVELNGSDHDMDQEETRIKVGKALLTFLKKSL
jgi:dipeptidyl aminopeptidase/acylaminoacyl peptidase